MINWREEDLVAASVYQQTLAVQPTAIRTAFMFPFLIRSIFILLIFNQRT